MFREMQVSIRADDETNANKVHVSFSSEAPYLRWFGNEILCHDEGCIDLSRLNEIGVLLFNHDRDKVIGRIEYAYVEDNRGEADVILDDDEASQLILQKIKSGTLKTTSVGYMVDEWEEVAENATSANGRFSGPCSVAVKWTPYEISIVSVPADPTVGVGRDLDAEGVDAGYSCLEAQIRINKNYIGG